VAHEVAGVLVAAIIIVAAVGTIGYRRVYGSWSQAPEHHSYYGRDYLRGTPALSRAEILRNESKTPLPCDAPYPIVPLGKVPPIVGRPLLAAVTPTAVRPRLSLSTPWGSSEDRPGRLLRIRPQWWSVAPAPALAGALAQVLTPR
jgi:hypothetical protein